MTFITPVLTLLSSFIYTGATAPTPTLDFSTNSLHCPAVPYCMALPEQETVDSDTLLLQKAEEITDIASNLLGKRYVWGAKGPNTFDCSGFTGYVFGQAGITLPRTSRMQYNLGEKVADSELQPGDLMFFSSPRTRKGVVGHVGIVVDVDDSTGRVTFIHASTKKGITYQTFPDGGYYTRNYIGAKRILTEEYIS
ncbi:MAG: C40 family peptidase [Paramuribaculum sp.]|nr:C40 family peptidase [Paramuribaculum sp.]